MNVFQKIANIFMNKISYDSADGDFGIEFVILGYGLSWRFVACVFEEIPGNSFLY